LIIFSTKPELKDFDQAFWRGKTGTTTPVAFVKAKAF
jgi:hypothetical protein